MNPQLKLMLSPRGLTVCGEQSAGDATVVREHFYPATVPGMAKAFITALGSVPVVGGLNSVDFLKPEELVLVLYALMDFPSADHVHRTGAILLRARGFIGDDGRLHEDALKHVTMLMSVPVLG